MVEDLEMVLLLGCGGVRLRLSRFDLPSGPVVSPLNCNRVEIGEAALSSLSDPVTCRVVFILVVDLG